VDNLIQYFEQRAQFDKLEKELIHCFNTIAFVCSESNCWTFKLFDVYLEEKSITY
jgi:hypothetical protein